MRVGFDRYWVADFRMTLTTLPGTTPPTTFDVVLERQAGDRTPTEDGNDVVVLVSLSVAVRWPNSEPGPFELSVATVGEFRFPATMPDADSQRLCAYHAPALLYSQIRPLVRMHAAEAGVPGFMLPLLNVAASLQQAERESTPGR